MQFKIATVRYVPLHIQHTLRYYVSLYKTKSKYLRERGLFNGYSGEKLLSGEFPDTVRLLNRVLRFGSAVSYPLSHFLYIHF